MAANADRPGLLQIEADEPGLQGHWIVCPAHTPQQHQPFAFAAGHNHDQDPPLIPPLHHDSFSLDKRPYALLELRLEVVPLALDFTRLAEQQMIGQQP
jgi:hypothetical protein